MVNIYNYETLLPHTFYAFAIHASRKKPAKISLILALDGTKLRFVKTPSLPCEHRPRRTSCTALDGTKLRFPKTPPLFMLRFLLRIKSQPKSP
jgi:hypothetical protein